FSSRRRHTSSKRDWSSDVCSSDLGALCLGRDAAEAFAVSETLEQVCEARVAAALPPLATPQLPDLGISRRSGPMFTLTRHGQDRSEERRVGKGAGRRERPDESKKH